MKTMKKLIEQDFNEMAPYVKRDQGGVPPIFFFHFDKIDPRVPKALNTTANDDVLNVEKGFFVPLAREALVDHVETYVNFLSTTLATITYLGIAGKLSVVGLSVSGSAKMIDKETGREQDKGDFFMVTGLDANGKTYNYAKSLKPIMGTDEIKYVLEDNDEFAEVLTGETSAPPSLDDLFEQYKNTLTKINEENEDVSFLQKEMEKDNPAELVAKLLDASSEAIELFDFVEKRKANNDS